MSIKYYIFGEYTFCFLTVPEDGLTCYINNIDWIKHFKIKCNKIINNSNLPKDLVNYIDRIIALKEFA